MAPEASGRVFISYRRQETAWPARQLYELLVRQFGPERVFKDVDNIAPGDDFVERITEAVGACEVLLALIGTQWLDMRDESGNRRLDDPDDFVRLEIQAALSRGVRVIPILVDGARMPRAADLPPELAPLTRRQAVEINPVGFNTDRLMATLAAALAAPPTSAIPPTPVADPIREAADPPPSLPDAATEPPDAADQRWQRSPQSGPPEAEPEPPDATDERWLRSPQSGRHEAQPEPVPTAEPAKEPATEPPDATHERWLRSPQSGPPEAQPKPEPTTEPAKEATAEPPDATHERWLRSPQSGRHEAQPKPEPTAEPPDATRERWLRSPQSGRPEAQPKPEPTAEPPDATDRRRLSLDPPTLICR